MSTNTIAAISTANGPGGIGVIRISGESAFDIGDKVFKNINGKKIDDDSVKHVNAYIVCFALIYVVSFLLISLDGFGFETNFTAISATMNNIGPGLGMVGPSGNFADFSVLSKIILTIDMICGRLELFPIMIILMPHTWKKN